MGDSSYWTGKPAVRAWEWGLVLYPNPQMSSHRSAVAKLTIPLESRNLQRTALKSFEILSSSFLIVSQIKFQGAQAQVMDGK